MLKRLYLKWKYPELQHASMYLNRIYLHYKGHSGIYRYTENGFVNIYSACKVSVEKEILLGRLFPILKKDWIFHDGKWINADIA